MSQPPAQGSDVSAGLSCRRLDFTRRDAEGRERPVLIAATALFPAKACTLVAGSNGSGKSTLLHLLGAILRPTAGEVLAGDVAVSRFTGAHRDRWRRKVGICFQRSELWAELSALENVMVPMVPRGATFSELRRRGVAALERVGMDGCAERPAGMLSVGERQRVALARALIAKPAYVLADEPTAHQDDRGTALTVEVLTEEARRGATVVITSHDQRVLTGDWTGQRYRLADGRLLNEAAR